jgi:hypothetical protein
MANFIAVILPQLQFRSSPPDSVVGRGQPEGRGCHVAQAQQRVGPREQRHIAVQHMAHLRALLQHKRAAGKIHMGIIYGYEVSYACVKNGRYPAAPARHRGTCRGSRASKCMRRLDLDTHTRVANTPAVHLEGHVAFQAQSAAARQHKAPGQPRAQHAAAQPRAAATRCRGCGARRGVGRPSGRAQVAGLFGRGRHRGGAVGASPSGFGDQHARGTRERPLARRVTNGSSGQARARLMRWARRHVPGRGSTGQACARLLRKQVGRSPARRPRRSRPPRPRGPAG